MIVPNADEVTELESEILHRQYNDKTEISKLNDDDVIMSQYLLAIAILLFV